MSFIKEFKAFALKGNVMDMAIGIIIGGAFGKIITSLVNDIIMPLVGQVLGGIKFSDWKIVLKEAVNEATPAVTLNIGTFIQTAVDFTIIALCIFLMIKAINNMKRKEETVITPPAPSKEETLLGEIRDILKDKK